MNYSSFSRGLRSLQRPVARTAFQPINKNIAPALSARFASTETAKEGKISAVIGAVVDGQSPAALEKTFPARC